MLRQSYFVLCVAAVLVGLGNCQCTSECSDYNIFYPRTIRPGMKITASITLPKVAEMVKLECLFYSEDMSLEFQKTLLFQGNIPALSSMGMIPLKYEGSKRFTMNITAFNVTSGAILFKNWTRDFEFIEESIFKMFIQTDKPIYKPSQTIKFRAMILTTDFFPIFGNVDYTVEDPQQNVILSKKNVTLSRGVVADELPLSKFAEIGVWKISLSHLNFKKTLKIPVTDIATPKYDVTVDAPFYFYRDLPGFTIKLNATYPSGEKVHGSAKVLVALKSPDGEIVKYSQITKSFLIFKGFQELFITREELIQTLNWEGISNPKLVVTGIVKEGASGFKYNDTAIIKITQSNIKVKLLSRPEVLKPGLPVTFYAMVVEQDGKPLMEADRQVNDLIAKVIYRYSTASPSEEIYSFPIPLDGIVKLNFITQRNNFDSAMIKVFTNTTMRHNNEKNTLTLRRAISPSDSFMQIRSTETKFSPGKLATIEILTTRVVKHVKILVISNGEIILTGHTSATKNQDRSHSFTFKATYKMSPYVKIMAYYTNERDEIVADSIIVPIKVQYRNMVNISSEEEPIVSGNSIKIKVNASSYSYIGIHAINTKFMKVSEEIENKLPTSLFPNMFQPLGFLSPSTAHDAKKLVKNLGVAAITTGTLYETPQESPVVTVAPKNKDFDEFLTKFKLQKYLSKFPETFLWEQKIAPWNGSTAFNITIPNKFSTSKLCGFAISYRYGLGIAEPFAIETSDKLFISLNLPLKVAIGEIAIAKVLIFNKMERSLPMEIALVIDESQGLRLIRPNDSLGAGKVRRIVVPSRDVLVVNYPIKFESFGEKTIRVEATGTEPSMIMIRDATERRVFVKPEGAKRCFTESKLIERKFSSPRFALDKFEVQVPEDIVNGTGELNITIHGDFLGKLLNKTYLKSNLPKGSGDLNLPTFAAALFTSLYLKKTGRFYPNISKEYYDDIIKSYTNELKYKRNLVRSQGDFGSFSFFGDKDSSSDITLTALVYKCFAFAHELNPELIDDRILNETFSFLLRQQLILQSVPFVNVPKEERSLRIKQLAMIAIALKETRLFSANKEFKSAEIVVKKFLEDSLEQFKTKDEPYLLSLVTYALHLTYSEKAEEGFKMLKELAITKDGKLFWSQETDKMKPCKEKYSSKMFASSMDVETASYALLTYAFRGEFRMGIPILKWLTSKQNILGLYSTAMDSIVAVQALATSAQMLQWNPQNISLRLEKDSNVPYPFNLTDKWILINERNPFYRYTSKEISPIDREIWVNSSGIGMVFAEMSLCYNTFKIASKKEPAFNCWYDSEAFYSNRSLYLDFCCASKEVQQTKQILYKIDFLNGFNLNESFLLENNPLAKNIEINKDNIIFYYDGLSAQRNVCASVYQTRYLEVAAIQPANITVWEYQKPAKKFQTTYNVEGWKELTACDVCGQKCVGCPAPQPRLSDVWTPCIEFCQSENQTQIPTCFDPTLNTNIDISLCEIESLNLRTCPKQDFPCPTYSDGLWYNIPPSLGSFNSSKCQVRGNPTGRIPSFIPGSSLDGQTSFIDCGDEEKLLESGFTYSFLMRFNQNLVRPIQLLYVGGRVTNNLRPAVSLEINRRGSLVLEINYKDQRKIFMSLRPSLSENAWQMITVTWRANADPKIYINGQLIQGILRSSYVEPSSDSPTENLSLFLGYGPGPSETVPGSGFLNGDVSGLTYWHQVLTQQQITEFFSFFAPLLDENSAEEPTLTPRQLNFFAPRSIFSCLKTEFRLSDLYSTNLPECEVEGSENQFGFPLSFRD